MLAVGGDGVPLDGDQIIAICALEMRRRGHLDGEAVVVTTMTNLGFRAPWPREGIEVRWTDVGDRVLRGDAPEGTRSAASRAGTSSTCATAPPATASPLASTSSRPWRPAARRSPRPGG